MSCYDAHACIWLTSFSSTDVLAASRSYLSPGSRSFRTSGSGTSRRHRKQQRHVHGGCEVEAVVAASLAAHVCRLIADSATVGRATHSPS